MGLQRFALTVLALASVALFVALPAAGKDGVTATLKTKVPLDAPAGERIEVAWTLGYADDDGKRRPFGASGIFLRLKSAAGAGAVTEYARGDLGDYSATVVVPKGGIGDLEIGLVGWQSGVNGTRRADAIFPITNDPLPGTARGSPATAPDDSSPNWFAVLVGLALALALLAAALMRRRPIGRFG